MWKVGDIVTLKWDDSIDNQSIIGKSLIVVKAPSSPVAPCWMDVALESGDHAIATHTVRGDDCRASR